MQFERRERQSQTIPLTPLIDVVFLLIVFFMLSTSFVMSESLEIALPSISDTPLSDVAEIGAEDVIYITLPRPEMLVYNDTEVTKSELETRLFDLLSTNPKTKIVVQSGEEVTVQQLVSVMDVAYFAGVKNLAIAKWQMPGIPINPFAPELPTLQSYEVPVLDTPSDREVGRKRKNQMPKPATRSGSLGTLKKQ